MRVAPLLLLLAACSPQYTPVTDATLDDSGASTDDTGLGTPLDDSETPVDTDNSAPVADAGPDQDVGVTEVVDLDGSASYDPDEDRLSYGWRFVSRPTGSSTSLINQTSDSPSFWADTEGTFIVELTVDDGQATATDEVIVTVTAPNDVPVAYAGADASVSVGDTVQLNGSGSYDPDNDPLTYQWTFLNRPSGSGASLSDTTAALPRFTADSAGTYVLQLVVSDGRNTSQPDTVQVTASDSSDGDCLSCTAQAEQELRRRWRAGDLAGGPAMVLLPLIVLFWQRREER